MPDTDRESAEWLIAELRDSDRETRWRYGPEMTRREVLYRLVSEDVVNKVVAKLKAAEERIYELERDADNAAWDWKDAMDRE